MMQGRSSSKQRLYLTVVFAFALNIFVVPHQAVVHVVITSM